jgi:hypothetical protein
MYTGSGKEISKDLRPHMVGKWIEHDTRNKHSGEELATATGSRGKGGRKGEETKVGPGQLYHEISK